MKKLLILLSVFVVAAPEIALADSDKKSDQSQDAFTTIMSTEFDFSETSITGSMKAPSGFFLQGRQPQSLMQMVRLRSNFKRQLRNSQAGVRSVVH